MKDQEIDWSIPQRQSPAAVFIVIAKALIDVLKFLWPLLIVILLRSSGDESGSWQIMVLIVPAISIMVALIELYFFRYSISNNDLIIRKGFIVRNTLVLPLEKIQAVHIDRTWLHNLFSVAQISFDSAGSEKMEIKINAIALKKAESLREYISRFAGKATEDETERMPEKIIITLGMRDLLKLSISANHLEAFFILLAFALSALDNIETAIGKKAEGFWERIVEFAISTSGNMVLFLVVAVLLISITISTIRTLLLYIDFRLSQYEKGFRIRTGLINMREKVVPFRKVQFMSWRANWLRTRMGLFLLKFHSVGAEMQKDKQQIKVPVTDINLIPSLVEAYHPLLDVKNMQSLRVQAVYVARRILYAGILPALVLSLLLYPFLGFTSLWSIVIIPFTAIGSTLFQRKFRLWANEHAVQIRKSVYGIDELIVKWNQVQSVRIQQSIYQRRKGLATVRIFTAGGKITVPYIKQDEAMVLMNFSLYKIESTNKPWL